MKSFFLHFHSSAHDHNYTIVTSISTSDSGDSETGNRNNADICENMPTVGVNEEDMFRSIAASTEILNRNNLDTVNEVAVPSASAM